MNSQLHFFKSINSGLTVVPGIVLLQRMVDLLKFLSEGNFGLTVGF